MTSDKNHDDDLALFREAMSDVRPITAKNRHTDTPKPSPQPRQYEQSEQQVMEELLIHDPWTEDLETGEELYYLKPGLQQRILRKLKRGQFSIQDTIDLHQMNSEAAKKTLVYFLAESRRAGKSCVKIIHGKGLRSKPGGPVLKKMVNGFLRRRAEVLAFVSARPNDGGTGAVYVLLKKS